MCFGGRWAKIFFFNRSFSVDLKSTLRDRVVNSCANGVFEELESALQSPLKGVIHDKII